MFFLEGAMVSPSDERGEIFARAKLLTRRLR
jgi:hypothetical protein